MASYSRLEILDFLENFSNLQNIFTIHTIFLLDFEFYRLCSHSGLCKLDFYTIFLQAYTFLHKCISFPGTNHGPLCFINQSHSSKIWDHLPRYLCSYDKAGIWLTTGLVDLYNIVSEVSDCPNYIYPRIPVHSELHISRWRFHLADYYDQQFFECLEFGFPIGIHPRVPLDSQAYNHSTALQYAEHVQHYINTEVGHLAMHGPYDSPPIPVLPTSPMMSRPKPNLTNRRIIVDLSWPQDDAVNTSLDSEFHLNSLCKLSYPTIDHV